MKNHKTTNVLPLVAYMNDRGYSKKLKTGIHD